MFNLGQAVQSLRSFANSPDTYNKISSAVNAYQGVPGAGFTELPYLDETRNASGREPGITASDSSMLDRYNRWVSSGRPNILPQVPDWARGIPLDNWERAPIGPSFPEPGLPSFRSGWWSGTGPGYGPYQALALARFMLPFLGAFGGPFGGAFGGPRQYLNPWRGQESYGPIPGVPEIMYL
jgi:hypothetical protein